MTGVAIIRGKSMPADIMYQEVDESKADFVIRVADTYAEHGKLNERNTLTIEYVWA